MHTIGEKRIRMLNPRDIKRPDYDIRTESGEEELSLLRDSIAAGGVLQPLLVKRLKKGKYQLIAGTRRLNAAIMANLRRVPCVVHNVSDTTALLYSITENIQNSNLSVFDEARAINKLIREKGITVGEMALKLGVSQSELYSKLQVLRLDERLIKRFSAAGLTVAHAKALLRLPKEGRAQALDTIIEKRFSAVQTEEYIFSILNPPLVSEEKPAEPPKRKTAIGDKRLFSNSLLKLIDTLRESGIKVSYKKTENEKHIEYKIKIKKENTEEFLQMKIC